MVKVLHIIRSNGDPLARRMIDDIAAGVDGAEQTLLLMQDGVYMQPPDMKVFAGSDDVRARGIKTDVALVEYDQIVEMIFEHDKVITW
jgi:sulfur relay protein TusB/DsrH